MPATKHAGGVDGRFSVGGGPMDCHKLMAGAGRKRVSAPFGWTLGGAIGTTGITGAGAACFIFTRVGMSLMQGSNRRDGMATEIKSWVLIGGTGAAARSSPLSLESDELSLPLSSRLPLVWCCGSE